jgi:predicted SnoaL-like aldol condensation-catalyzing enzyme
MNLEQNKIMVRDFYETAFNLKKPREAAAKYLGPYYRQHNPGVGDGPEPFIAFTEDFVHAYPDLHSDFKKEIAEGDLVMVQSHITRAPGDRGLAAMDIFRLEQGKIVEHWDTLQEVPGSSNNANTMF